MYNILEHYCAGLPTFRIRIRTIAKLYSLTFQTRSLPCFNEIYNMFYPNGKKIVPAYIYNYLTPISY